MFWGERIWPPLSKHAGDSTGSSFLKISEASASYHEHGGWVSWSIHADIRLQYPVEVLIEHGYILCNPLLSSRMSLTTSITPSHTSSTTSILEKMQRQLRPPCLAVGRCSVPLLCFGKSPPTFPRRWGPSFRRPVGMSRVGGMVLFSGTVKFAVRLPIEVMSGIQKAARLGFWGLGGGGRFGRFKTPHLETQQLTRWWCLSSLNHVCMVCLRLDAEQLAMLMLRVLSALLCLVSETFNIWPHSFWRTRCFRSLLELSPCRVCHSFQHQTPLHLDSFPSCLMLLSDVWVHIYHCDPYTGFLNRFLGNFGRNLKKRRDV